MQVSHPLAAQAAGRALVVALLLSTAACKEPGEDTYVRSSDDPEQLMQLCVQCHGEELEGNQDVLAPAIAGLPAWYTTAQLMKFKSGARATHFDDIGGMRMRPMSMSLTDEDVVMIAERVAKAPAHNPPKSVDGDATRGKELFAPCVACHGPAGAGVELLGAPALTGASDWYMLTQLKNFKAGVRGANPKDTSGATMRPMAQNLPDEQAMKDVIAYIGTLK